MPAAQRIRVGIVGLGYWGSHVARNLSRSSNCRLVFGCDVDPAREGQWRDSCPNVPFTLDLVDLLDDDDLDAVIVTTPVSDHVETAERILEAGKHCFVEKPLAQSLADAERLTSLAARQEKVLMVGHLLEFHPGIEALKGLIDAGELGEMHYIYSQRLNLGRLRADENALWSLGAHDVSVALALTQELPFEVGARGESYVREGVEDVVFAFLRFSSGVVAHMHLSWLDPHKERRFTVVGSQRMATFDDMAAVRKLTVFDKGFDPDGDSADDYVARFGEARSPVIGGAEPLRVELEHFLECIGSGTRPRTDGANGVRVVNVLEALQRSLDTGGAGVALEPGRVPG